MKISYNWLKQYIDFDLSPSQLENKMTFSGIEVEAIEQTGEFLKQFKVAKIVSIKKHENADSLNICEVDDGNKVHQVVCGAPNCDVNQKIAFAPIGTNLGDFKIKKAKLRGVKSFGMICSEKEMEISDNHDGIMVLDNDAKVGSDIAEYLKKNDTVFDVEITPNRPDLLGMIGVARDLSAQLNIPIKLPQLPKNSFEKNTDELIIENQAPDKCLRYSARLIKNVTIKE
ncbi:MAG: phenylalanine--tRNA ligase subunit beta, partial [Candidatus Cloacimonadota bacterium]|nr:phenylalanine--tRNA ligase subunit beta [Candidatus Cloacimonadota bacterium]